MVWRIQIALCIGLFAATATAQPSSVPSPGQTNRAQLNPKQKFVIDVVRSAVALPVSDPQDRLRILAAAAQVVSPVSPALAQQYAREGARVEADLIAQGERPAVSVVGGGHLSCAEAAEFVESVPDAQVRMAEQSLVGVVSACPRQTLGAARRKLESALDQGTVAARAILATMEQIGVKSAWAQSQFLKIFSSLTPDFGKAGVQAPQYAALFVRMAPEVEKGVARRAGLKLLDWLSNLDDSSERRLAVNLVTNAMRQVLGGEAYDEALRGDVVALSVAATSGQPGFLDGNTENSVSVLGAMSDTHDHTESLAALSPALRARKAAAYGFATGTKGDRKQAERYFDVAFAAADEVWSSRDELRPREPHPGEKKVNSSNPVPATDPSDVVREVSEAAAQVSPENALLRAQDFSDPAAEGISMLSVARVVLGRQEFQSSSRVTAMR